MTRRFCLFISILVAGVLACGCTEKLTYAHWQTLHEGMTAEAVQAALGKPWQTTDQTWVYYDQDKAVTVMVYFDQGKVTGTTWSSPEHGIQGRSPNVQPPEKSEQTGARATDQ